MVLGPLRFVAHPSGFALQFEGSLLQVDDGSLYLRLEHAFARSRLIVGQIDLTYRSIDSGAYGAVTGAVRLGRRPVRIEAFAFSETHLLQRTASPAAARILLAAAFGAAHAISLRSGGQESPAPVVEYGSIENHSTAHVSSFEICGAGDQPAAITATLGDGRTLAARPVNRILISRPLGSGLHELVNLGVARFTLNGGTEGAGVFEYTRRFAAPRDHYERSGSAAVKVP